MTGSEFSRKYISVKRNLLVCTICNTNMTKFSVKKHLKRFHATTKAYYCEICCEGFHRPDVRMNHMRMVHPSSLNCFDCKTQFYCSKDYSDHMTVVHNTSVKYNHAKKKELVDVPIDRLRFVPEIIRDNVSVFNRFVLHSIKLLYMLYLDFITSKRKGPCVRFK